MFVNDILKHSNEEKENFNKDLTRCTLGCLMKELFSEQVRQYTVVGTGCLPIQVTSHFY